MYLSYLIRASFLPLLGGGVSHGAGLTGKAPRGGSWSEGNCQVTREGGEPVGGPRPIPHVNDNSQHPEVGQRAGNSALVLSQQAPEHQLSAGIAVNEP